jgi:ATP-dependent helicase/nuclease subunit A
MPRTPLELKRIIQAGAGAGKTTELVGTFINFSLDFKNKTGRFPRTVICTFTRKATFELRERLVQKCLELGNQELLEHLSRKSAVHISTIHGVCALFLEQQGGHLGFEQPLQIVSPVQTEKIWKSTIRNTLKKNPSYLTLLDHYKVKELFRIGRAFLTEQNTRSAPLVWGKEHCLRWAFDHLANLAHRGNEIGKDLSTFSLRSNWAEFVNQLGSLPQKPSVCSFENFLDLKKELSSWRDRVGKRPSILKDKDPFDDALKESIDSWWKEIKSLEDQSFLDSEVWQEWENLQQTALHFFLEVSHQMKAKTLEAARLTFSELEEYSLLLARQESKASVSFSSHWDFWMIDEYQDTSPLQEEILRSLIQNQSQFIVGDPQQSIYLFRGADSSLFEKKINQFKNEDGEFRTKKQNFRSYQDLIHIFNKIFFPMGSPFIEMTPDPSKPLRDEPNECSLKLLPFSDEQKVFEVDFVASQVRSFHQRGARFSDICILARTGEHLKSLARGLEKLGLPVQLHQQVQFFEQRQVIDAIGFLKFLMNPHQDEIFIRVLRSPWLGIRDDLLVQCVQSSSRGLKKNFKSIWSSLREKDSLFSDDSMNLEWDHTRSRLSFYLDFSNQRGLSQTLHLFLNRERVWESLSQLDNSGQTEAHLVQLLDILQQFERSGSGSYVDLLKRLDEGSSEDLDSSEASPLSSPERIQMMTIHASKGLQFPHVILVGLHKKIAEPRRENFMINSETRYFSLALNGTEGDKIYAPFTKQVVQQRKAAEHGEQKRVLYVAFTRAQKTLTLIWQKQEKPSALLSFLNDFDMADGIHQEQNHVFQVLNSKMILDSTSTRSQKDSLFRPVRLNRSSRIFPLNKPSPLHLFSEKAKDLQERPVRSVSQIVGEKLNAQHSGEQVPLGTSLSLVQLKKLRESSLEGTRLHRIFEGIKYQVQNHESHKLEDLQELLNLSFGIEEMKKLDFIFSQSDIPFFQLLKEGRVEWGFQISLENQVVKGQIDLWGIAKGTLWIIDYKTGASRYEKSAQLQLQLYHKAIIKIYPRLAALPTKLLALYVNEQKIISLPLHDQPGQ